MSNLYVILRKQGYTFAADGMDYVIIGPMGGELKRDMHKGEVEKAFFQFVKDAEYEAQVNRAIDDLNNSDPDRWVD